MNEFIILILNTVIAGLLLALILYVIRKLFSHLINRKTLTISSVHGKVTFLEILRSEKMDVIKIDAHSEMSGVAAEYEWIKKMYPNSKTKGQSLRNIKFSTNNKAVDRIINFDQIEVLLENGKNKSIFFEINTFFGVTSDQSYFDNKLHDLYS
jgi:hypothetical protein